MPGRLYPRHLDTFVRLDMRPQTNIIRLGCFADSSGVLPYASEVE
jgi:hypothetical protein